MFYIQYDENENILTVGACDFDAPLPVGTVSVTEQEYNDALGQLFSADEAKRIEREAERQRIEAERLQRIANERAKKATIIGYVNQVLNGELELEDVPQQYFVEVKRILNPPPTPVPVPTNEELAEQLAATQEALDFILMNMEV